MKPSGFTVYVAGAQALTNIYRRSSHFLFMLLDAYSNKDVFTEDDQINTQDK